MGDGGGLSGGTRVRLGHLVGPKPVSNPFSEWVRNLQPAPRVGSTQHELT